MTTRGFRDTTLFLRIYPQLAICLKISRGGGGWLVSKRELFWVMYRLRGGAIVICRSASAHPHISWLQLQQVS